MTTLFASKRFPFSVDTPGLSSANLKPARRTPITPLMMTRQAASPPALRTATSLLALALGIALIASTLAHARGSGVSAPPLVNRTAAAIAQFEDMEPPAQDNVEPQQP